MLSAIGLSLVLSCGSAALTHDRAGCAVSMTQVADGGLRQEVMDAFSALCAKEAGIFNEDISFLTSPYFPSGQAFDDTVKVVRKEGLRELRPFHGKPPPGDSMVYVTGFTLMSAMFSHVYVTIDLEFARNAEGALVLRRSSSFLRASNM